MAKPYEEMSPAELEAVLIELSNQKDAVREEMRKVTAVLDLKKAEISLVEKMAQFSPAEIEVLKAKSQTVQVQGIEPTTAVGKPKA